MKKLFAIAALLLASTAAQAQYTFETAAAPFASIRTDGTVSIPGVYDKHWNARRRTKRFAQRSGQRPSAQAGAAGSEDRTAGARSNTRSPRSDGKAPAPRETFARASTATARPRRHHRIPLRRRSPPPAACAAVSAGYCPGHQEPEPAPSLRRLRRRHRTEPAGPATTAAQSANSPLACG